MTDGADQPVSRRTVLAGVGTAAASSLAGCSLLDGESDGATQSVDDDRAADLAATYAPTLYFDEHEQWFPTDPRPYESEVDGDTVVDGFDALDGYVDRGGADDPPAPTAFYNVVEYADSPLAVVQFWLYSAFDQFTTNFHWHDWEVLHVFVDTDDDEPQLYVASSHSRTVPNNEHLDPDPSRRPRILTELGSHSSGLSVNEDADSFQRLPLDDAVADVTNSVLDGVESLAAIPLAYGLPRDEGLALPFVVPELDGAPVHEHDRLPSVTAEDLVADDLTVRSFDALASPPDLPQRDTGRRFEYEDADDAADADHTYALEPAADLEHIAAFTGPQLSFEFAVPGFAEDAVAGHITTTGVPWHGERYENPAADVSEPKHRQALADRYDAIGEPSPVNQVVATVTEAVSDADAPDGEGLLTDTAPLEFFALLQSDPEALPTFNGVAVARGLPEGDHEFTVNGAGVAPHSETVRVESEGTAVAGVDGEIPVVANENAVKLSVDPSEADSDLTDFAVEDDFAGRLYDAPLDGPDAVYAHRGGAFTAEVRDSDGEVGASRVNPAADASGRVQVERPQTGKESLASYLADVAGETSAAVAAAGDGDADGDDDQTGNGGGGGQQNAVEGLATALDAVADAAERAAENAAAGDRGNADQALAAVGTRLDRVASRLADARGDLPDEWGAATERRLDQARRRTDQARDAEKL